MGNTDGILSWNLGNLEPAQSAQETIWFAFGSSREQVVRIMKQSRDERSKPRAIVPTELPPSGSSVRIANETTDFALARDGSFLWEGQQQALNSPQGGQFSQFA